MKGDCKDLIEIEKVKIHFFKFLIPTYSIFRRHISSYD